MNA
ncbi:Protein of unknown function [Bacillus cereus]|jgi:hypothetical protein